MIRRFEVVRENARTAINTFSGPSGTIEVPVDIQLPSRADKRSAGYDFYSPVTVQILPGQKAMIFTDVKAFMQPNEVLLLYIRSSLAVKHDLMLANNVGVIDSSYYGNPDNDGNIGICILNKSGRAVTINAGDKIAQGIFQYYFVTDDDAVQSEERIGGFGSSGK